ncbi:hypothetical protein C8R45DRAFT_1094769 [Mycena sanguinolenta]|nr:hypothetical protein C8R45DRAFT_1094769 [Mycena sanguinolenta]
MAATAPPDALLLTRYGCDTMRDVVGIISQTVFCSAYGIFFALAMYSICQKGLRSRKAIIMFLVVVYLYADSVTQWAVASYITLKNIYCIYITTDVPLLARAELADNTSEKFSAARETIFDFNMIIADAVVIWLFALIDITCSFAAEQLPESTCTSPWPILVWAFSVGTNIASTSLIGWKARQHRNMMKELNIGGKYHGISAGNILSLFVESGLIYSVLWIIQIIGYLDVKPDSPLLFFGEVLVGLGYQMTGLYPTLIIVLVNFKRTIWDNPNRTGPNSLQWAVNTHRSGTTRKFDVGADVDSHLKTVGEVMSGHSESEFGKQAPVEKI